MTPAQVYALNPGANVLENKDPGWGATVMFIRRYSLFPEPDGVVEIQWNAPEFNGLRTIMNVNDTPWRWFSTGG